MRLLSIAILLTGIAAAQNTTQAPPPSSDSGEPTKTAKHSSAKHDVGTGAGDIGMGAAKGAGSLAKGTGKAAGDLVTLHPAGAAAEFGRGAAGTGKNVGVGTVKGTAKIFKGTGKAIKHLF